MKFLVSILILALSTPSLASLKIEAFAEKLHQQGQYQKAVDLLSKNAEKLSDKGYLTLAASYSELKEYDNELRILGLLEKKDPKNYQWKMLIAQSHLKKSRAAKEKDQKKSEETEAVKIFRDTIKANSKFKPAYDQLLEIFLEKKEHHEARELLMAGIAQFGERAQWMNQLCELQANDGFLAQAQETCEKAIRRSPHFPNNYVFLSQSYLDQNESEKAQKVARLSGMKFPKSEFAQWGAGKVYLIMKNYEAATKYFNAAIKADSKSMRAHLGAGEALFESGNRKEALTHFRTACKLGARVSEKLHVMSAETRMKGDSTLAARYRGAADTCH